MLIITNLQLEREIDFKEYKKYIFLIYALQIQNSLMIRTFGLFLLL